MMLSKITHAGNIIIAGFIGMIFFMSFLVYSSINENIDMVSKNYYEEELVFQNKIDAKENALPFANDYAISQVEKQILLQLPQPLAANATSASVVFYCLANSKFDKTVILKANTTGLYTIDTKDFNKANYKVKVSIEANNKNYYKEMNLSL
jgi:hypothetical protein